MNNQGSSPWTTNPTSPASVEEALRAIDKMIENDSSDDDDDDISYSSASSGGSTSYSDTSSQASIEDGIKKGLLPTFNSKGKFTSYDKRTDATERELESSPYGFHLDSHSIRSAIKQKEEKEISNKQTSAATEFLNNPNGMNWEDLVASMKKEKKKKKKKKRKSSRSSSSSSSSRKRVGSPTHSMQSGVSRVLTPVSELEGIGEGCETDEDEDLEQEETVDFMNGMNGGHHQQYEQQEVKRTRGVDTDTTYDEEFCIGSPVDVDNIEVDDIDFHPPRTPTSQYTTSVIEQNLWDDVDNAAPHNTKRSRSSNASKYIIDEHRDAISSYKKQQRNQKFTIALVMAILFAGIVAGVMIAVKRTIHPLPERPICIIITTGTSNKSEGFLDVYVDTDDGFLQVTTPKKEYAKGDIVVEDCYTNFNSVHVRSKEKNAWDGSIFASVGDGGLYKPMICNDCTGFQTAENIVVDGKAASYSEHGTTFCFNGDMCRLTVDHGLVEDELNDSADTEDEDGDENDDVYDETVEEHEGEPDEDESQPQVDVKEEEESPNMEESEYDALAAEMDAIEDAKAETEEPVPEEATPVQEEEEKPSFPWDPVP